MSQYPYGYGQYYGSQQQQQQPYPYPPYGTASYPTPAAPVPSNNGFAASQGSFDYNANRIPGLGIFGSSQDGLPFPGQPNLGWGNGVPLLPNVSMSPGIPLQNATYPPSQTPGSYSGVNVASSVQPQQTSPADDVVHQTNDNTAEEGELSEGELDDLYEAKDTENGAGAPPSTEPAQSKQVGSTREASESDEQSGMDIADTPLYDTEAGEVVEDHGASVVQARARDRSGSYSPYLSPREVQRDSSSSAGPQQAENSSRAAFANSQQYMSENIPPQNARVPDSAVKSGSALFRSVGEAKKEAQKAILRLLPHGVKYQTYIDEGFDEQVVKTLFTELNLVPALSTNSPSTQQQSMQPSKDMEARPQVEVPASTGNATSDKEERKDRIARLLAAKKAAKTKSKSPEANTPPSVAKVLAVSKPRSEKNILLQQKMEALAKSRESRAQKAAAQKKDAPQVSAEDVTSTSVPAQQAQAQAGHVSAESGALSSINQLPIPETQSRQSSRPQSPHASQPLVPFNLPQSSTPPSQSVRQRKRPVAADFVDYPSVAGSLKRPFGQGRQESSLVIDISDGSDDEDVEMEMDSPIDGTSSTPQQTVLPRRGPAIRDFPPLSNNYPQRQFSSPVHPSHNSPAAPNGKPRESELERKMREIEEYKKKIARAEAKKKAKQGSTGPQTPSTGNETPPEVKEAGLMKTSIQDIASARAETILDDPSAQILLEAQSLKLTGSTNQSASGGDARQARRLRIASLQPPNFEASLEEKRYKLKLLRDEEAKLQAELDQALAEQRRLAEEMDLLDTESPEQSDDQDSEPISPLQIDEPSTSDLRDEYDGTNDVSAAELSPEGESGPDTKEHSTNAAEQSELVEDQNPSGPLLSSDGLQQSPPETSDANITDQTTLTLPADSAEAVAPTPEPTNGDIVNTATQQEENPPDTKAIIEDAMEIEHITGRAGGDAPSDVYGAPDTVAQAAEPQVAPESPPFSPAPPDTEANEREVNGSPAETTLPTQISSVDVQASDAALEEHAETAEPVGEGDNEPHPNIQTSLTSYVSPLRYFHAYRFHPLYNQTVRGGLKSLTYSNRIDVKKEVCPFELAGQVCPNGDSCPYQHFKDMAAPDDKILLELGRSDDYNGEQKNKFVAGLRDLLTKFRAQKTKDFPTIANGIIHYRRQFLGDPSKILHLEGVTV